jgi:hypothetical protein
MKCSRFYSEIRIVSILALVALGVSACMKPSARAPDPNANFSSDTKGGVNQPAATFYNDEVTGGSVVSKNMPGFSIPSEKLFNFKVCVKDKRTQESIKGHKFNVLGSSGNVTIANNGRSDESGCLNWSEAIAFNGMADAKFIPLTRRIVADGMHKGGRDLKICINPWDSAETVRDCEKRPVPQDQLAATKEVVQTLNGESAIGEKVDRQLWIDDLRFMSAHDPGGSDGALLDFNVAMGPKILTKNVRGNSTPLPLADGQFSVQFWIVGRTGGKDPGKCLILAKSEPSSVKAMIGGRLRDELNMKANYKITYGQLELVGVITPQLPDYNIQPYNGIWIMGDHTALLGMKFGFDREAPVKSANGSFNAKKYLETCTDVSGNLKLEAPPVAFGVAGAGTGSTTGPGGVKASGPGSAGTGSSAGAGAQPKVSSGMVVGPLAGQYPIASEGVMSATQYVQNAPSLYAQIPDDLKAAECVHPEDIPRLFPLDSIARNFKPGTDVLTCENEGLPSGVQKVEQFKFDVVDVRAEPIADPINGETTTERTVKYLVTTTVRNPLAEGTPLQEIEFLIKKSDGSEEKVRTNNQGQLKFNDEIKHVYFHPERYMLKVVQISHASGFSKRLPIVFNPWDNNGFTFGRDIRRLNKRIISQVNLIPRPKSELLLTQFQWGTQGFRYEVDDFLNLSMFKQFNLTINPRVLRYSSLTEGRMKNEALRDGVYLMKVAIQKDYKPINEPKPLEFVTAIKKLVRVANGIINTPVEMNFQDFRVLKIRSNIMIEIQTIDEAKLSQAQRKTLTFSGPLESLVEPNSGLAARTFVGPVVAYSNGFSASMRPTDDLAESVCETIDCDEIKRDEARQTAKVLCSHSTEKSDVCSPLRFNEAELKEIARRRCALSGEITGACAKEHFTETERKELAIERETFRTYPDIVSTPDVWKQQIEIRSEADAKNDPRNLSENDKKKLRDDKKKYRGSIEHLAHKTVGDMIERRAVMNAAHTRKVREAARLGSILDLGNFEFGSFANEAFIAGREKAVATNNWSLPNGNAFATLVQKLSATRPEGRLVNNQFSAVFKQLAPAKEINVTDLRKTLFENGSLTYDQAARLCFFFVEDLMLRRNEKSEESMSFADRANASYTRRNVNEQCLRAVFASTAKNSGGLASVFNVEHLLRVSHVSDSEPLVGTLMSLGINSGASFDRGSSQSESYGWNPLSWVKEIPVVGTFFDASGLSFSMSASNSKGVSEGGSVGSGTSLAVEMRGMQVEVAAHERCTAIRLSDSFFKQNVAYVNQAFPKNLSDEEKVKRMTRGLLLCEGILRRQPVALNERYYQFSQSTGEEALNDVGDILNHPFLLTVRGRTDYIRFANILKAQPITPKEVPKNVAIETYPIERLMKAFGSPSPTFPGVLRLDDETIRQMANPSK